MAASSSGGGQAIGREHHEADEGQAKPEQPVVGVDREELAKQDVEQDAHRRPEETAHAADHHHGQHLTREGHRRRFGRRQAVVEHEQCTGQAGDGAGDDEGHQLVAVGGVALKARALLVLADRHQYMAKGRSHDALHHIQ
jgi:hypothetical protein